MTAWWVQSLAASTILMIGVLLIRPWTLRRFGPRLTYGLWLLPAGRLALPPMPGWTLPALAPPAPGPDTSGLTTAMASQASTLTNAVERDAVIMTLLAVWALGAILYLAWGLLAYGGFMRRAAAAVVGPEIKHEGVVVWTTALVRGPVAAGVWRRRIFLPLDFALRFSVDQQGLALAHERAHHRRGDIVWNFVALAVVSIHWFNPLAHRAYRLFRLDQELACDADVLAAFPASRWDYGALLAREVSPGGLSPVCALALQGRRAEAIKQRLVALAGPVGLSPRRTMACLVPAVVAGLMLTAPVRFAVNDAVTAALPALSGAARPMIAAASKVDRPAPTARIPVVRHRVSPPRAAPAAKPVSAATATATPIVLTTVDADPTEGTRLAEHLALRRAAGLARSRPRLEDPARTARDRGRSILMPPSPDI